MRSEPSLAPTPDSTRGAHGVHQLRIPAEPGVVLAATLHLPADGGEPPFPVVLAIPGGGPGGRHCYDFLKKRFLDDGIALLEYDKRGVWESTGEHTDTLAVQMKDATVVLDFLRSRADLDRHRTALIGLCHGAVIAPALAAGDPEIGAVVMLSGPVGPGPVIFAQQMRAALFDEGMPVPAAERLIEATRCLFDARARCADAASLAAFQEALVESFVAAGFAPPDARRAMFWLDTEESLSMWTAQPDQVLTRVRVPVLALYGAVDTYVSSAANVPTARAALAGNPDATVVEMPGLNHLFQHAKTGSRQEMRALGIPNSAPEMIRLVGDWVRARLRAPHVPAGSGATPSTPGLAGEARLRPRGEGCRR